MTEPQTAEQWKALWEEERRRADEATREKERERCEKEEERRRADEATREKEEERRRADEAIREKEEVLRRTDETTRQLQALQIEDDLQLPDPIPRPSSASQTDLTNKTRIGSATIHRGCFDALRTLVAATEPEAKYTETAVQFVKALLWIGEASTRRRGLFSGEGAKKELIRSSVLQEILATHLNGESNEFHWYHQLPDTLGSLMDIALYVEAAETSYFPASVIECSFVTNKDKQWQAKAYSINVSRQLRDASQGLLSLELYISARRPVSFIDRMVLRGYTPEDRRERPRGTDEEVPLWTTLIWDERVQEGEFEKSRKQVCHRLACLFKCMVQMAEVNAQVSTQWIRLGANVAWDQINDRIYKCYDYRHRAPNVKQTDRRNHELTLRYMPGSECMVKAKDLVVVSYARRRGKHNATSVGQFGDIVRQLRRLHDDGICHGDIRAFNMLFGPTESCLIDFDFAGRPGEKVYPEGFNVDLADCTRHAKARASKPIQFEHDWYSLASVMRLYTCADDEDGWQELATKIEDGKTNNEVTQWLEEHAAYSLLGLREEILAETATGSPPRVGAQKGEVKENCELTLHPR